MVPDARVSLDAGVTDAPARAASRRCFSLTLAQPARLLRVFASMSEVTWQSLLEQPERHLVVVSLPQQASATGFRKIDGKSKREMFRRLLKKLPLAGFYALTIQRARGTTEMMCGFECPTDAAEAAQAVGATEVAPYEGWRTQRAAVLDYAKEESLLDIAGRPGARRRPEPVSN